MAISFNKPSAFPPAVEPPLPKRKRVHRKPEYPPFPLDKPGLLRICHLMALFNVSDTGIDRRIKKGLMPPADGFDGRPYWKTETIRALIGK